MNQAEVCTLAKDLLHLSRSTRYQVTKLKNDYLTKTRKADEAEDE